MEVLSALSSLFITFTVLGSARHKDLIKVCRDLPIIATRIERSNYPERKRHQLCVHQTLLDTSENVSPDPESPLVNVSIAGASAPHTESLMAQGDSDRDGDYLCWHWTSSHDTALSPPPEIVRSQDTALVYTVLASRGGIPLTDNCSAQFPLQLQIGQNLMKRWFKIPGWGSWMDWTRELITHQALPARKQ